MSIRPITTWNKPSRSFYRNPLFAWSRPSGSKLRLEEYRSELYNEAIKAKCSMNRYSDENVKLKTKLLQHEAVLAKKDKLIRELHRRNNMRPQVGDKKGIDQPIVAELKRQAREISERQRAREEEVEELRKSLKMARLKDLEARLRAGETECARLKQTIIELVQRHSVAVSNEEVAAVESKMREQSLAMQKFEEDRTSLISSINQKEEELTRYKEAAVQLDKRVGQAENNSKENAKVKRGIAENKKKIKKFKELLSHLQVSGNENESTTLKRRINEMMKRQSDMNEQLNQKDCLIEELEERALKLPPKSLLGEIRQARVKLEACSFICLRVDEMELRKLKEQSLVLPIIADEEAETIAQELRILLILSKVPLEKLQGSLSKYDKDDTMSILELSRMIQRRAKFPNEKSTKLCRYIIEPRNEGEVLFSEYAESNAVESINKLLKLLGSYSIDEDRDIENLIKAVS